MTKYLHCYICDCKIGYIDIGNKERRFLNYNGIIDGKLMCKDCLREKLLAERELRDQKLQTDLPKVPQ